MRINVAIIGVIFCTLYAVGARADGRDDAKQRYRRGTVLFNLQRYAEAAREYEAAYELKEDPVLLFNIAQAYRLGGESAKALGAYKSYLRVMPNAPNKRDVQLRIEELQQLVERQGHLREAPPTGTMPPAVKPGEKESDSEPSRSVVTSPEPPSAPPPVTIATAQPDRNASRRKKITGIAVGAAGVALLAAGGGLLYMAASASSEITNAAPGTVFDPGLEQRVSIGVDAGAALMAIGGVGVAAGVTMFMLGHREGKRARSVSLSPTLSPHTAGVSLQGAF